jgi:AraC family transcriptional activator FtrA
MHKVAILTYHNAALFELGCAVELFGLARPEFDDWYEADVISFEPGPLDTTGGLQLIATQVDNLDKYDTLVVPSWPTNIKHIKGPLAEQLPKFKADGKRILSFCSGAFLLAALGLLDDRKATTHWRYADKFKQRFTSTNYVDDVLYTLEDNIGCSAGSAAAIDLGIAIIRHDYGYERAKQVARRLVMSAHRKGGQSQFVETRTQPQSSMFDECIDWAQRNLDKQFSINDLAKHSHMSRRTFDRKFRGIFNTSAKDWLIAQRLDLARQLLETQASSIEQIAEAVGFDNATTMRHHFRRKLGVSPRQYRDQFSSLTKHLK